MKNFRNIKKGTSIYWEMKPSNVTDRVSVGGKIKISLRAQGIGGYTNTAVTSPADIFLPSDHVIAVSDVVVKAEESFYEGFHDLVDEKICDMFLTHWKSLCRAEGKKQLYDTRKKQFDDFLAEITKAKEMIKSLKVCGVLFIKGE
ncbi:MAG: hypothetical protein WAZ12_01135 [Candidatus Absconditicoccaceae bacterium]